MENTKSCNGKLANGKGATLKSILAFSSKHDKMNMQITGKRKREIEGFENYEISETGKIYSLNNYVKEYDYMPILSTRIDRAGYVSLRLSKDGKTYTKFLHRLLGIAFIPNPENKRYLNHKNGKKWDYTLSNLEWTDHSENVQHAYSHGLNSWSKKIINIFTGETFPSIADAAKSIGINYNTCCKYLKKNKENFPLRYLG
jgi:hypothetical protein